MWATRIGSFVFLASALVLSAGAPAPPAYADECRASCSDARRGCNEAGRAALESCRLACEANGSGADCKRDCRRAFNEDKMACVLEDRECRQTCRREPTPLECVPCDRTLRSCLQEVCQSGRECTDECMQQAAGDLIPRGRERQQFIRLGRVSCLHGCAEGMLDGADACQAEYAVCREECD